MLRVLSILILSLFFTGMTLGQEVKQSVDSTYTPYELMSSYYKHDFKPFKKKNIYVGLAFSLEDKKSKNTDYIVQKVIDGEELKYNLNLKGGYFTGDYGMIGLNFNYYQDKFIGTIDRNSDTLKSNSITRGFNITPNFRSPVPLTENERLSFFTEIGLSFGGGNTLTRNTKNLDEIEKSHTTNFNFRIGISPGITFFAMENFAFEIQLNVLGYELSVSDKSVNGIDESRVIRQNVDFNIDLLSLDLGLAYYIGGSKK